MLRSNSLKRCMALCAAVVLTMFGVVGVANATAIRTPKHCITVVEKIPGQHGKSRVVSNRCSTSTEPLFAPASDVLLVTFYQDAVYGGDHDDVYGSSGPCDSEGYGLSDLSDASDNVSGISSYIYGNDCNDQTYWTDTDYSGASNGNLNDCPYVGDTWNDNLYSMKLRHS